MPESKPKSLFISYRRSDSAGYAGRIYDHLFQRFDDDAIFMDVINIPSGANWRQKIRDKLDRCDVLLALIGTRWLTVADEYGRRRLDKDDDLVKFEIQTALERKITVIPVIVDDAKEPDLEGLPDSLKSILEHNACHIRHNRFHQDIKYLLDELSDLGFKSKSESQPPSQTITVGGLSVKAAFGEVTLVGTPPSPIQKIEYIDSFLRNKNLNEWQKLYLGDCVRLHRSKTTKNTDRKAGDIPYYSLSGVTDHVDYFDFEGRFLLVAAYGSNLIDRSKPITFIVDGKFAVSDRLYVIELKSAYENVLSPEYLEAMLSMVDFRSYVQGTGQPALRKDDLLRIPIAIPTLQEQIHLVNLIQRQLSELNSIRVLLQEQLEGVDTLESALRRRIFEGMNDNGQ